MIPRGGAPTVMSPLATRRRALSGALALLVLTVVSPAYASHNFLANASFDTGTEFWALDTGGRIPAGASQERL